jgi:FAD/FMN-containing dehydrogenase
MVEIVAGWEPDGSNGAAHRQWAQDLWESLAPFALPGGYANFLTPHDREQARNAYGSNGARLRSSKRRFDPDGVFASAIPLPEAGASAKADSEALFEQLIGRVQMQA